MHKIEEKTKRKCPLCGVKGKTFAVWNASYGQYKSQVECENPMCIGNRLDLK